MNGIRGKQWTERTAGAVIGSAVGDALGAPFEFGPAGAFSARWTAPLHVPLPGFGDRVLEPPQLLALAHRLAA